MLFQNLQKADGKNGGMLKKKYIKSYKVFLDKVIFRRDSNLVKMPFV